MMAGFFQSEAWKDCLVAEGGRSELSGTLKRSGCYSWQEGESKPQYEGRSYEGVSPLARMKLRVESPDSGSLIQNGCRR